ncbi:endo-1,4-beta-xylanase [Sorangium sp. So ce590]|uniref:endo-1,4-beta-xylanase n=1 Tax=Sorangium sp. So ce590 TaxID=3133317 RepID=UPI003F601C2D
MFQYRIMPGLLSRRACLCETRFNSHGVTGQTAVADGCTRSWEKELWPGIDGASGWDWIVNSFKWAREYCPRAVLILNDYNNIEYENDHNNFMRIARAVINAGAPVDALGAQAHDAYRINTNTVKGYIDKMAALGKPVHITEYDIGIANDAEQRRVMQEQFTMFWNHPSVPGITLWGYIVGATWRDNTGIQHSNGTMRPAMTWLMDFLDR